MLRFASTPTGDMHIGNLRVALFNFIVAQQRKEALIVRIEDTEKEKNIEGKDQEILGILDLFDIKYSQTIYQSQNFRFHSAMALQLMHEKKAFSCFCSPDWIQKKIDEAETANKPYLYDDACANLPAELVIDNTSPFTVRINRPIEDIIVSDLIKGKLTFKADTIDSFMILKQDKTPMYDFACAVDDMLSDISLIILGEDNMDNTPKQVHVRAALQYDKEIQYTHVPNILNDDEFSVKQLLEQGYLPSAIANYLLLIGNKTPKKIFTMQEAVEWFNIDNVSKSPESFDINMLKDINKEHLKNLDAKELSRYVGFADEEIGELARLYLEEEVGTTKDLKSKIEPIFAKKVIPDDLKEQTNTIKAVIKDAPYFDEYNNFKDYVMKESGLKEDNFIKPLRLLLTGTQSGPDIEEVYKYLKNYLGGILK